MNTRANRRIAIARNLMNLDESEDVLARIKALQPDKRDELRGLVDWVEDYEIYEANRSRERCE